MTTNSIKKDDKTLLLDLLNKLCIINSEFTGRLVLNFNQGGLNDIERTEKIK